MIVRHGVEDAPPGRRSLALGTFDGVHLGHQRVIRQAVDVAAARGLSSAVATFHPHPMTVLRPELAPHELSTLARKMELLGALGVEEAIVIRFDLALSRLTHEEFAAEVLAGRLGASHVVVGANFRYGNGARGTIDTLRESGALLGFTVEAAELVEVAGAPVSSSRIRDLVGAGEVTQAAALLGRDPWIEGVVVRGDGRGRGLGFPTANLHPAGRSVPPGRGVYAGRAHLPGRSRPAAISVGYNPTFSDDRARVRIEAHLLDFDEDIYDSPMMLELSSRLRDELRFNSVDDLIAQMHRDVDETRARDLAAVRDRQRASR